MLNLILAALTGTDRVLMVGDSWAYHEGASLQALFDAHSTGAVAVDIGVPGSYASVWAASTAVASWLAGDPSIDLVHIELGLNDLLNGVAPATVAASVFAVVTQAEAAAPTIEVAVLGYDYPDASCTAYTQAQLGALLDSLSAELAVRADADPRCTFVPTLGLLGGSTSTATPAASMADCLHLASWGWATHVAPAWSAFYAGQLVPAYSPAWHGVPTGCAGSAVSLVYAGMPDGDGIVFVVALSPGTTVWMGNVVLANAAATLTATSAGGVASLSVGVPAGLSGITVYTQAADVTLGVASQIGWSVL